MQYFAGIDGGQTSTVAVVADETGKVLGRGEDGPADEIAQSASSTRLRDALANALSSAVEHAGLPSSTRFVRIVAGISGYEGRVYGQPPVLAAEQFSLVHDSEIAHSGALNGDAGVVVISGTGSVAYGKDARGGALVGGWGYIFGDEGSAFWLAREALSAAMRDHDDGESNDLAPLALAYFKQPSLRALSRAFYANEISRATFALFAAEVLVAAQRGNGVAAALVRSGAKDLVMLGMHAMARAGLLPNSKIAFTGGVMRSATVREQIAQAVRSILPSAQLVQPKYDAPTGALLLAYRAAGLSPETIA